MANKTISDTFEKTCKILNFETKKYVDLPIVFQRLCDSGYVKSIYDLFQDIFLQERNFAKEEKIILELGKNKKINVAQQIKMNGSIFKINFELIVNLIINAIFNQIYATNTMQVSQEKNSGEKSKKNIENSKTFKKKNEKQEMKNIHSNLNNAELVESQNFANKKVNESKNNKKKDNAGSFSLSKSQRFDYYKPSTSPGPKYEIEKADKVMRNYSPVPKIMPGDKKTWIDAIAKEEERKGSPGLKYHPTKHYLSNFK